MDQVDQKAGNQNSAYPDVTKEQQADAKQKADDLTAGISCYTTDCDASCKKGTNQVAQMNGQPGSLSTNDRCSKGKYRNLCCDDGTTMGTCQWRGYRGVGLSCISGCADGETEVVQDTNHKEKKSDQTCSGGLQSKLLPTSKHVHVTMPQHRRCSAWLSGIILNQLAYTSL